MNCIFLKSVYQINDTDKNTERETDRQTDRRTNGLTDGQKQRILIYREILYCHNYILNRFSSHEFKKMHYIKI